MIRPSFFQLRVLNAKKMELTFNISLPFIPSVGGVSGIVVDGKGPNVERSLCNSDVLLCQLCLGLWSGATVQCS